MNTDLFDYPLPERLIAQRPADRRDESRLLVVDRQAHTLAHRHFRDLPEYLRADDTLFRNNAAVIPARLHATRPTGGQVECLLLRPAAAPRNRDEWRASSADAPRSASTPERDNSATSGLNPPASDLPPPVADEWWCLLRPGKKLPVGAIFSAGDLFTGIVHPATATHRETSPGTRAKLGITEGLIRISVGIEDLNDIFADLEQALYQSISIEAPLAIAVGRHVVSLRA